MSKQGSLTGYLSLTDAEDRYGISSDTLKKRCQKGSVVGAIKIGKMWFVPNIPGIDPEKSISENYPKLDFDAAFRSNISLYDYESDIRFLIHKKHKSDIYIWEYGFYYFSLIFNHAKIDKTYLPLAVLVSEAHTALRSSFLLNIQGYHSDAISLLRRTQECTMKAIAMRKEPRQYWKTGFSNQRQQSEGKIGTDFKGPWSLSSSFTHGNLIKLFEIGRGVQENRNDLSVTYGPQYEEKLFSVAMNGSIFWLFTLISSLPYIFTGQIGEDWIVKRNDATKLLKDYLVSKKSLIKEIESIEKALNKIQ